MNNNISSSNNNDPLEYWCDVCEFNHTRSKVDYKMCNYCHQYKDKDKDKDNDRLLLLTITVYYNYGFSMRHVSECRDCQKEEMDSLGLTFSLTPVTWHNEAYESICEMIKEMCSKPQPDSESNVVNYYDVVKRAYEKEAMKILDQYNPMTIRDHLLARGVNSVNKIDKNLKALWEFTFRIVNNNEERIKVVNKDPDNMLVSWIDS
jgi:hypothetical protein